MDRYCIAYFENVCLAYHQRYESFVVMGPVVGSSASWLKFAARSVAVAVVSCPSCQSAAVC